VITYKYNQRRNKVLIFGINNKDAFQNNLITNTPSARFLGGSMSCWSLEASPFSINAFHKVILNAGIEYQIDDFTQNLLNEFDKTKAIIPNILSNDNLSQPLNTKFKPWHHQLVSYNIANELPASMQALDMGCGKTKVSYDLMTNTFNPTRDVPTFLVLCPKYIISVWKNEVIKHSKIAMIVSTPTNLDIPGRIETIKREYKLAKQLNYPICIVINYESLTNKDMQKFIKSLKYDIIFCDESHRIKAPKGIVSQFVRSQLYTKAIKKVCLTGTPFNNLPNDIWGQYAFLNKSIFGTSYSRFRDKYFRCDKYHQPIALINEKSLHDLMFSICYQVKAEDVLDLPDFQDIQITGNFSDKDFKLYNEMELLYLGDIRGHIVTAANAAVKTIRLRQLTSGFLPKEDDENKTKLVANKVKQNMLKELLSDIPQHEQIVVVCNFHYDLDVARFVCTSLGIPFVEVSGRPCSDDTEGLKMFGSPTVCNDYDQKNPQARVLIGQQDAIKEGIDLTNSRIMIFYNPMYVPGTYNQLQRRLVRPGQDRSVLFYHLSIDNTVDDLVFNSRNRKQNMNDTVLSYYDNKIT